MKAVILYASLAVILIIIFITTLSMQRSAPRSNPGQTPSTQTLVLRSSAFNDMSAIPPKYTCDGQNINPPLEIRGVDPRAVSLVLFVEDPDAPHATWNHWVKFNIPPTITRVEEGKEPQGTSGAGTAGNRSYEGPCPPSGTHRYIFRLYSLDSTLNIPEGGAKDDVERAMTGHIIQEASLTGLYSKGS